MGKGDCAVGMCVCVCALVWQRALINFGGWAVIGETAFRFEMVVVVIVEKCQ